MLKGLKDNVVAVLEGWGKFRLVLTIVSLASLVWGAWFNVFPMPFRIYKIAKVMGVLLSVIGILFSLAWKPDRPLFVGVIFFVIGWCLFTANYVVASVSGGFSEVLVITIDVLQITMFAGFFFCFAMTIGVCIREIILTPQN